MLPCSIASQRAASRSSVEVASVAIGRHSFEARRADRSSGRRPFYFASCGRWVDGVLSGMFDWLYGWSKLPNEPQAKVARSLLAELFPKGLKFTQLPYKLEWSQVEARIVRIDARGLDTKIRQLGGAPFLTQLRKAHKEYGEALGITGVLAVEEPAAGVRDAYDNFLIALRNYVLKVAAHVEPDEPETGELAAILLAPLHAWRIATAGSARDPSAEEPAPEPAPADATDPS